jgi:hypothetical protein
MKDILPDVDNIDDRKYMISFVPKIPGKKLNFFSYLFRSLKLLCN